MPQEQRSRWFSAILVLALAAAMLPALAHAQTYTVLYNFGAGSGDPINPDFGSILAQGRDGFLYSTSTNGGSNSTGTVYKASTTGVITVLKNFDSTTAFTYSGLTLGTDGNLYGANLDGGTGTNAAGTAFKITPTGTFTVLHNFVDGTDGGYPQSPPIQASDGNYYGVASGAGIVLSTLYKVTSAGVFTALHTFAGGNTDAGDVIASPIQGTDGNLYGCSYGGGTTGNGTIFKSTTAGHITVLHSFTGTDGSQCTGLIQGTDGNLYGATASGGTGNSGVVFKSTTGGTYTLLHSLNGTTDGQQARLGLQATDGNLYGEAVFGGGTNSIGTIFKVTTSGTYTVLYSFVGNQGDYGENFLTQHTNGLIYGTTASGGAATNGGVLFSLNVGLAPFAKLVTTSGKVGSSLEILGQGLTGTTSVKFNGVAATTFSVSSDTYMTATVPSGAKTGTVTVTAPSGIYNSSRQFRVTPTISSIAPTVGAAGTVITVNGTGLTQTTKVTVGGVNVTSFTINSDSKVSATAPTGVKTGKVVVTTSGGSATSASTFSVIPTILSFSPTSGPVGTSVVITGTGLSQTNQVTFNGTTATVFTINSDTQVTATVPTGATTGKIAITTTGGVATSATNFTVM